MARQLYVSQVRPIIEFGATTLPYSEETLIKLERMQDYCMREFMGFYRNTKRETMLVLFGLVRIRARIAQLKLVFLNKLKLIPDSSMYLYRAMTVSFEKKNPHGLYADVQRITGEWSQHQDFSKLGDVMSLDDAQDHRVFAQLCKATFEQCDRK